jgi:hypothetical protein
VPLGKDCEKNIGRFFQEIAVVDRRNYILHDWNLTMLELHSMTTKFQKFNKDHKVYIPHGSNLYDEVLGGLQHPQNSHGR